MVLRSAAGSIRITTLVLSKLLVYSSSSCLQICNTGTVVAAVSNTTLRPPRVERPRLRFSVRTLFSL